MFTKRHEQELAEIKALTYELGQRCHEILKELERISAAQVRLGVREGAESADKDAPKAKAAPKAASKGKPGKKPRSRPPAGRATGAKQAKRRGGDSANGEPPRKRRRTELSPNSGPDES